MNKFDDARLISLAKTTYYGQGKEPTPVVKNAFTKASLTNDERNALMTFIEEHMFIRPLSMKQMKREILTKIGYKNVEDSSSNVMSSREVAAIYEYFMKLD